jgi:hypothetical protein
VQLRKSGFAGRRFRLSRKAMKITVLAHPKTTMWRPFAKG